MLRITPACSYTLLMRTTHASVLPAYVVQQLPWSVSNCRVLHKICTGRESAELCATSCLHVKHRQLSMSRSAGGSQLQSHRLQEDQWRKPHSDRRVRHQHVHRHAASLHDEPHQERLVGGPQELCGPAPRASKESAATSAVDGDLGIASGVLHKCLRSEVIPPELCPPK